MLCETNVVRSYRQQTFVLMKTTSRRLDQDEYIHLSHTSSEDVSKTSSRRLGQDQYISLGHTPSRHLPDLLKTSLICLAKIERYSKNGYLQKDLRR